MKRTWRVFRAMVLARPVLLAVLLLIYGTGIFLATVLEGEDGWIAVLMLGAFTTTGVFAMAAERMTQYAVSAGELGIPGHTAALRATQWTLIALFIVIPLAWLAVQGAPPLKTAAILSFTSAFGVTLGMRSWMGGVLLVTFVGLCWLFPDMRWLDLISMHVAALAAALYVLYHWYLLPARIDKQARERTLTLADALHERTDGEDLPLEEATALETYDRQQSEAMQPLTAGITDTGVSSRAIGLGLNFDPEFHGKSVVYGLAIGIGVVAAWHFMHASRTQDAAYLLVSAFVAQVMLTRLQAFHAAWTASHAEQSLLVLTPRWPSQQRLKRQLILMLAGTQTGAWLTWLGVTATAWMAGWAGRELIAFTAIGLFALSCAGNAALWALLSRPSVRQLHLSTILILLSAAAGALLVHFGPQAPFVAAGFALILAPAALSLTVLLRGRLQFPVNRVLSAKG